MNDFAANMMKGFKESFSALEKSGLSYLSADGHSFLQKILNNLTMALWQNKKTLSAASDNLKENNDKKWVSVLNSEENWVGFKANKTREETKDINMFPQFWVSQNQFALASNESLVESLHIVLFYLNHVKAALKEYEKNERSAKTKNNFDKRLPKIHSLKERLKMIKSQLTNAMFLRLKIAHNYSHRKNCKIPDVDDVVYYITHSLHNRKALSYDEQKTLIFPSLLSEPRQTLFFSNMDLSLNAESKNYYVKFYDCVKMHGNSQAEIGQIDAFHWSRIINKAVFPLTSRMPDYGLSFSEVGKEQKTRIAVPSFLNKFVPAKRQTPEWWHWQDNLILDFWAKRQNFLASLHRLYPDPHNPNSNANAATNAKYAALINAELNRILKEDPTFLAFRYKDMLKEWTTHLKMLSARLSAVSKNAVPQTFTFITQQNRSPENKKDGNAQSVLSESADVEYRKKYTSFKSYRKPMGISAIEARRFNINGDSQDGKSTKKNKKQEIKNLSVPDNNQPSRIEAALRMHR